MRQGFLIDTNVISDTRKPRPNAGVTSFFKQHASRALFLSVLTIGELRKGAAMRQVSHRSSADQLSNWIDGIESRYAERLLPVDLEIARAWGELASDRSRPIIDTLLLATAVSRGLTLVTRNVIDVRGTGARVLNPFE